MTVDWAGDQPELAADVSEDDDDTAGPGKPREKFSRRGIPCATAGVEHIGECFIWVSARWMDNVTDIDENLAMRKDWLKRHQAGDQDIPVAAVQELMRIHRNRWMSQRKQKLEEMASAYGSRSGAQRSLTSMHRTWAYARFGGLLWMQVVLAWSHPGCQRLEKEDHMEDRTAPAGYLRGRSKVLASPLPTAGGTVGSHGCNQWPSSGVTSTCCRRGEASCDRLILVKCESGNLTAVVVPRDTNDRFFRCDFLAH